MNDKDCDNVTYRHVFIVAFLIIVPSMFWAVTDILVKRDKSNGILSLFLMGIYALVYVITLYMVADKMLCRTIQSENERLTGMFDSWKNNKKIVIVLIYVTRYLARTVFLLYFFVNGIKLLMLQQHPLWSIFVPLLLFLVYLGNKGIGGYISFGEAVFWSVVICIIIFLICIAGRADMSQFNELMRIEHDGGICYTICSIMVRGYMLLVGLSAMEFIIYLYVKIKNRKRIMLISAISIPTLLSTIGYILVIITLGKDYINQGIKEIQDIVGAFAWPGGYSVRLGVLVCYVFIVAAIMITGIHVVFSLQIIKYIVELYKKHNTRDDNAEKQKGKATFNCNITSDINHKNHNDINMINNIKKTNQTNGIKRLKNIYKTTNGWINVVYMVVLIIFYTIFSYVFKTYDAEKCGLIYMLALDIPLSIIVPAFACRRKGKPDIYAKTIVGILALSLICTGCSYKSVEDVDYLRIVMVEQVDADKTISFTLIADSLSNAASVGESENIICTYTGTSLEQVISRYDFEHEKQLDMSHVEYIVVDNDDTLVDIYKELEKDFGFNYVEIVRKEDIPVSISNEELREYISNHYKGECLATYKR